MLRALRPAALCVLLLSCPSTPPAVATCTAPQSACGAACANLALDDAHCGTCENACGDGSACANGSCFPTSCNGMPCDPGSVCFQNLCTQKECVGVLCPAGQVCSGGACVCGPGRTTCSGQCVDLELDDANCGGCGNACAAGSSCAKGVCVADDCPNEDCDPLSVCFAGACTERSCVGVICSAGNACANGTCQCSSGIVCATQCTDVKLDSNNCGGCGQGCDGGTRCATGVCLPTSCNGVECDPLSVCYGGNCVEAACVGVLCPAGEVCSQGRCVCPAGKTACSGACANLTTSAQHCGQCGRACGAAEACVGGQCVQSGCMPGRTLCNGACVDTQTDPQHCSACGDACGGGRNCVGGVCTCPQSLALCGGACVNLATDPANCGRCGKSCGGGACQTDGGCACAGSGLTFCSGTCADLMNDPLNCNACGRRCAMGETCSGGACQCPMGQRLCGGRCIDVQADNLNCGMCGMTCSAGTQCTAGMCIAPVTCAMNFNSAPCAYFPLDDLNCGQPTVIGTQPFAGMLAATNDERIFAVDAGPSSRLTAVGSYQGSGNVSERWRNGLGAQIGGANNSTTGSVPVIKTDVIYGNPYTCANPVDLAVRSTFSGPTSFMGNITHEVLERYNTYGVTNASAPSLNLPDGGVCTQVCGNITKTCGDERAWYRVTIPARRALVLEYRMWGPANIDFQGARPSGAAICDLTNNALLSATPSTFRGRMANNTDVPQEVVVGPYFWGSGNGRWTMAAGLE